MGKGPRRLFQIWEDRTLPLAAWEQFVKKVEQAGSTPAHVLRDLIEQYNARPNYDIETWTRFTDAVTGQGQTIADTLAALMRQYIAQHERPDP